jgi:UDP-GlcNAc:undecaprenyl-phosphate/decaprenyl-phosphate GlcNAc-1-phosphate transferase
MKSIAQKDLELSECNRRDLPLLTKLPSRFSSLSTRTYGEGWTIHARLPMRLPTFPAFENLIAERAPSSPQMSIGTVLLASLSSAGISLVLCFYALPICRHLDILDMPGARKMHAHPTPLLGGIALQMAAIPIVIVVAFSTMPANWTQHLVVWAGAVAAMTLIGLADDRHTLSARDRLLVSFLVFGSAAIIDPLFKVRVLAFESPSLELGLGTGWLAVIFTTVCCVGLVNAVNMADGKNGLVIGLFLGWSALLAAQAPDALLPIIAAIAATWATLLTFNLRGKLFLGDGGAYGGAGAIGLIAIAIYNTPGPRAGRAIAAEELMLLFSIPVLDSFRLTFARLRQGRSPMSADRNHLHHHLQNWFGWPLGLLVYLFIALTPAAMVIVGRQSGLSHLY